LKSKDRVVKEEVSKNTSLCVRAAASSKCDFAKWGIDKREPPLRDAFETDKRLDRQPQQDLNDQFLWQKHGLVPSP